MKKIALIILVALPILGIAYFAGPKLPRAVYNMQLPTVPATDSLEQYLSKTASAHQLKPGNQARIVWADSPGKQTKNVVIYLHGFSASHEEGNPIHLNTAKSIGANLLLTRLSDHGIDTLSPMALLTPERLWNSAKQALAVGRKLGERVVLVGTSTGGSLALQLAAAYPDEVQAVVLLSPNIAINDQAAFLLNDPWGLQIARMVVGGDERKLEGKSDAYKRFWYTNYRLEAVVALEEYLETTMHDRTFRNVRQPVLMLYYYKNEQEQDPVVKVSGMLQMYNALGTPTMFKFKKAIPTTGNHVIGSYVTSKDIPAVQKEISIFMTKLKNTNIIN